MWKVGEKKQGVAEVGRGRCVATVVIFFARSGPKVPEKTMKNDSFKEREE